MLKRVAVLLCLMVVSCAGVFAQWEILNPKPAGFTCNKIVFTDAQNGFILNSNGDLIKTTDQGAHWNVVQNFPSTFTMDLKYSTGLIVGNGVLYISSDNGNSWQRKNTWFTGVQFVDIVSRDTLFLASSTGTVYRSDDRGNTWQFYAVGTYLSSIEFVNSKVGYAGGSSQYILKTIDGGATWTKIVTVNTSPSNTAAINFLDENTGFAFRGFSDLLRTSDGGATWTISQVPDQLYTLYFINKTTGFGFGQWGVAYRTDDGGVTWKWIGATVRIDAYHLYSAYFFDGNTGITVGARGRILKTTDGGTTWNTYAPTYLTVNSLAVPDANTAYATVGNTLYKSGNSGQTWQQLPLTSNDLIQTCYFFNKDTGIVTASRNASLYKTYDGGNTWQKINPYQYAYDYVTCLQFFDDKTGVMNLNSYYGDVLLKTYDAGDTWSVLWQAKYQGEYFTKFSFVNQQVAYASRDKALYKSTDGGSTWTLLWQDETITSICFVNEGTGFVAGENSMLKKTIDSGKTWTSLGKPVSYDDIYAINFLNDKTGFFTSEYGGIYRTEDGGNTWWPYGKVTNMSVRNILFKDTLVYLAGEYGIIARANVKECVMKSPMPVLSPSGIVSFCQGNNVALSSSSATGNQWLLNGVRIPGATNRTYIATNGGTYQLLTINGCAVSDTASVILNEVPLPATPVITAQNKTLVSSASSGNEWYSNGRIIYGATGSTFTPDTAGVYTVRTRTGNCYSAFSAPYNFAITGINSPELERALRVGPNPVPDQLSIQYTGAIGTFTCTIMDMWGRNLYQNNFSGTVTVDMHQYLAGPYIIYIKNKNNGQEVKKLIMKN